MKKSFGAHFIAGAALITSGILQSDGSVDAGNMHTYLWANYNQFCGNNEQASAWYQRVFESNPSLHSYRGYLYHLDETGKYQEIVDLFPKIKDSVQEDAKVQLIHALALEQVGRSNASDEELIRLQAKFKGDKEITFYTANKYLRSKEPENALSVIDDFLKISPRRPQNFIFYFMKSQIYSQLNKNEDALASIKQALQLHPQFDKAWLLLALLEEQAGKVQEAIQGYTSYLEITTEPNKNIEQHLLQLALKQELAQKNKRMVTLDPACFEKAAALFERKQFRQALSTINECLTKTPSHVELRLLKLRTLMAMEQQTEAIQTIGQWIGEKPEDELWYKTLHLLVRSCGRTSEAIATLKLVEKKSPKALLPALYLADLTLRSQDNHQAQHYLARALDRTDQSSLKVKILFQLGRSYFQMNDPKRMGEVLERAHALDPNFVPVVNLLAYHTAHFLKDHARAQRLISSALQKHPKNIHLLETQAMINQHQKQPDTAKDTRELVAVNASPEAARRVSQCPECERTPVRSSRRIEGS